MSWFIWCALRLEVQLVFPVSRFEYDLKCFRYSKPKFTLLPLKSVGALESYLVEEMQAGNTANLLRRIEL